MSLKFGPKLKINKKYYYLPRMGSFAFWYEKNKNRYADGWYSCREEFHKQRWSNKILYRQHPTKLKNIARFINKIEEKLGIKAKSKFGLTQIDKILWAEISPWWNTQMRRNFLTMMFRAGHKYDYHNFDKAIWGCKYSKKTKKAVLRFLDGYTHYTGRINGWYEQFYYECYNWKDDVKDETKLKRLLVKRKPKQIKKEASSRLF